MKKAFLLPIVGALLASCGVVEVKLVPPVISNLQSQATFCTNRDTLIDFRFDKNGLLTRLEVYVTKDDPNFKAPTDDPDAKYLGDVKFFDLGNNNIVSYIAADTDGNGRIQSLKDVFASQSSKDVFALQSNGVNAQTIVVTPVPHRLWVRGFNVTEGSAFVKADNAITPSSDPNCDPIFPYGDPNR
ncbi:MAG: hypothetical protein K6T35_02655 [Meiothermus silvanus]|nr:hypothetical protein [Allomeiothermus silvanus]